MAAKNKKSKHARRLRDQNLWDHVAKTVTPLENREEGEKTFSALFLDNGITQPTWKTSSKQEKSKNPIAHATSAESSHKTSAGMEKALSQLKGEKLQAGSNANRQNQRQDQSRATISNPASGLDRKLSKKLQKGKIAIDSTLDLHGLTQAQAQSRLLGFIKTAHGRHARTVLVITGKGSSGEGVLRRAVPMWLCQPMMRQYIGGFDIAHQRHGGEGALYVRLKRSTLL